MMHDRYSQGSFVDHEYSSNTTCVCMLQTQINIEATINGTGGHAMTPPSSEESAVSKLARFIAKLEADQTGPRMVPPVPQMLQALAHGASSKLLRIMLHNADHW